MTRAADDRPRSPRALCRAQQRSGRSSSAWRGEPGLSTGCQADPGAHGHSASWLLRDPAVGARRCCRRRCRCARLRRLRAGPRRTKPSARVLICWPRSAWRLLLAAAGHSRSRAAVLTRRRRAAWLRSATRARLRSSGRRAGVRRRLALADGRAGRRLLAEADRRARGDRRVQSQRNLPTIVAHERGHLHARDNLKRWLMTCAPDVLRWTPLHREIVRGLARCRRRRRGRCGDGAARKWRGWIWRRCS